MSHFGGAAGAVVATFVTEELEFLAGLPAELREVLAGPDDDPAVARLFPRAYLDPTEETAEEEWQALVRPDLLHGKLEALAMVATSIARVEARGAKRTVILDADEAAAWLGVLNDARLALGARLGVTGEIDTSTLDPQDAVTGAALVFDWLALLQYELLEVLALPEG